jgi:hypothetical protein
MYFTNKMFIHGVFIVLASLNLVAGAQAAPQDMPVLVAKPYPGAVPENSKDGKHIHCNASETAYCFLTRDTPDKVRAFYAKEGIKVESLANEERAAIGGWLSNFEQALRVDLESKPSALFVAPLEFYQTKGADDEPSYFNGVIVMAGANRGSLQGDSKGQQAMIDDEVLGHFALSPISKIMVPLYGNIYMEPARLVPHYNRHLGMLSGYFREVDGSSAAKSKYLEMHPTWVLPVDASGGNELDAKQDAMREELREILSGKPEKKNQYQALRRSVHNKESREKIQPELDKILMSDPELAAWKKRSDALEQQEKAGGASAQSNRTVRDEDVEAYLQALEKEVYYTRILIHVSGGRSVKRDAATLRREWRF